MRNSFLAFLDTFCLISLLYNIGMNNGKGGIMVYRKTYFKAKWEKRTGFYCSEIIKFRTFFYSKTLIIIFL